MCVPPLLGLISNQFSPSSSCQVFVVNIVLTCEMSQLNLFHAMKVPAAFSLLQQMIVDKDSVPNLENVDAFKLASG